MRWYDFLCPFPNQADNILWRPIWEMVDGAIQWGYELLGIERRRPWN